MWIKAAWGLAAGLALVAAFGSWRLDQDILRVRTQADALRAAMLPLHASLEWTDSQLQAKRSDVAVIKAGFLGNTKLQKDLFESGLSLQEERRLLDKQWEIMMTSLILKPELARIILMRADQPVQGFYLRYIPLRAFGGSVTTLPPLVRIVSKERFAHPERGKAEMVGEQLVWTPPQVGTSIRSRALGEFVMFTNSKFILHGPPVSEDDHARYPHICVGLDRTAAQRLYRASFIGTEIHVGRSYVESVPVPPADVPVGSGPLPSPAGSSDVPSSTSPTPAAPVAP